MERPDMCRCKNKRGAWSAANAFRQIPKSAGRMLWGALLLLMLFMLSGCGERKTERTTITTLEDGTVLTQTLDSVGWWKEGSMVYERPDGTVIARYNWDGGRVQYQIAYPDGTGVWWNKGDDRIHIKTDPKGDYVRGDQTPEAYLKAHPDIDALLSGRTSSLGSGTLEGRQGEVDMSSTAAALCSLDYWAMEDGAWIVHFEKGGTGFWYHSEDGSDGYAGVFMWKVEDNGTVSYKGYYTGPNANHQISDDSGSYTVFCMETNSVDSTIDKVAKDDSLIIDGYPYCSFEMSVPTEKGTIDGKFSRILDGHYAPSDDLYIELKSYKWMSQMQFLSGSTWVWGSRQYGKDIMEQYNALRLDSISIRHEAFTINASAYEKGKFLCRATIQGTVEWGNEMCNDAILNADAWQLIGSDGNVMADYAARKLFVRLVFTEQGPQLAIRTVNDYYESRTLCEMLVPEGGRAGLNASGEGVVSSGNLPDVDVNNIAEALCAVPYWYMYGGAWVVHFDKRGTGWWYRNYDGTIGDYAGLFTWDEQEEKEYVEIVTDPDSGQTTMVESTSAPKKKYVTYTGYQSWPVSGKDITNCKGGGGITKIEKEEDPYGNVIYSVKLTVPGSFLGETYLFTSKDYGHQILPPKLTELLARRGPGEYGEKNFMSYTTFIWAPNQNSDLAAAKEALRIDKLKIYDNTFEMDLMVIRDGIECKPLTVGGSVNYADPFGNNVHLKVNAFSYEYRYDGMTVSKSVSDKNLACQLMFTSGGVMLAVDSFNDAHETGAKQDLLIAQGSTQGGSGGKDDFRTGIGGGEVYGKNTGVLMLDPKNIAQSLCAVDYWSMEGGDWVVHFDKKGTGWWYNPKEGGKLGLFTWDTGDGGYVIYIGYNAEVENYHSERDETGSHGMAPCMENAYSNGTVDKIEVTGKAYTENEVHYAITMQVPETGYDYKEYRFVPLGGYGGMPPALLEMLRGMSNRDFGHEHFITDYTWVWSPQQPGNDIAALEEAYRYDRFTADHDSFTLEVTVLRKGTEVANIILSGSLFHNSFGSNATVLHCDPVTYQYYYEGKTVEREISARDLFCRVYFTDQGPGLAIKTVNDIDALGAYHHLMVIGY